MQIYARMNALVQRYCDKELLFPELQAVVASLGSVGILSVVPPSTKVGVGGEYEGSSARCSSGISSRMMSALR